jgi:hypothetical protein
METVLNVLYDLTGVPEIERKDNYSPRTKVAEFMKQLDKTGDNTLSLKEFGNGCLADPYVRKILLDPLFHCSSPSN